MDAPFNSVETHSSEPTSERASVSFLSSSEWEHIGTSLAFSRRESEIAALILANRPECEIGQVLGISSHTVHSHLERLYRKLRVRSRPELLLRIFETYVYFRRSRNLEDS